VEQTANAVEPPPPAKRQRIIVEPADEDMAGKIVITKKLPVSAGFNIDIHVNCLLELIKTRINTNLTIRWHSWKTSAQTCHTDC
jgi:hypothetical protein